MRRLLVVSLALCLAFPLGCGPSNDPAADNPDNLKYSNEPAPKRDGPPGKKK